MAKAKEQIPFEDFMAMVDPAVQPFVAETDGFLREGGCLVGIQSAKSGYVVSYKHTGSGRVLLNYVFRKKGLVARIYADNILAYMELLDTLPKTMKDKVAKAPVCRRLINPELCSPHCPKGYEFILEGENYQKCRYSSFMFFVEDEAKPHIRAMLEREMAIRNK